MVGFDVLVDWVSGWVLRIYAVVGVDGLDQEGAGGGGESAGGDFFHHAAELVTDFGSEAVVCGGWSGRYGVFEFVDVV